MSIKKAILPVITGAVILTGCGRTPEIQVRIQKDLRETLQDKSVEVQEVSIKDTMWMYPNQFNNKEIRELEKEISDIFRKDPEDILNAHVGEDIEKNITLRTKIDSIKQKQKKSYGFKLNVIYRTKADTAMTTTYEIYGPRGENLKRESEAPGESELKLPELEELLGE